MIFDIDLIKDVYANFDSRIDAAKAKLDRPLTLAEKILLEELS